MWKFNFFLFNIYDKKNFKAAAFQVPFRQSDQLPTLPWQNEAAEKAAINEHLLGAV